MQKGTLRIALLGAGLTLTTFVGIAPAQTAPGQQQQQPQQRPRRNPADMLKNYRTQFEGIDLTDDQMAKIDKFIATAEKGFKDLEGQTGQEARQQSRQIMRTLNEDVQSILTDKQKQALQQKRQQQMVDRMQKSYTDPKLNLTSDQQTKITGILDDFKKQLGALSTDPQDRRQVFQLMRDTRTKLDAVLTPDQLKLMPRGFGGRRGNRGGQGGAGGGQGGNAPAAPAAGQ